MLPLCTFIHVCAPTLCGCLWINWCQAKPACLQGAQEEGGGGGAGTNIVSSENDMDELSAFHWLMHMRTHTEQTQQEQIWRRQDKQAGGHRCSWSPQGLEEPNQFVRFRGKWWESGRSKEDGWDRDAANMRINNIHSPEEKIRKVKAFFFFFCSMDLSGDAQKGSWCVHLLCERQRARENRLVWAKRKK